MGFGLSLEKQGPSNQMAALKYFLPKVHTLLEVQRWRKGGSIYNLVDRLIDFVGVTQTKVLAIFCGQGDKVCSHRILRYFLAILAQNLKFLPTCKVNFLVIC